MGRYRYISRFGALFLLLLSAGILGASSALAQTGPGGVGDSTSSPGEDLTLWLRSDVGVDTVSGSGSQTGNTEVERWRDQSGQGHDLDEVSDNKKRQPIFEDDALNGKPVIKFNTTNQDNTDALKNADAGLKSVVSGSNTFFVLSVARRTPSDNFWQVAHFNQEENIGYPVSGGVLADDGGPTLTASVLETEYNVVSSVFDNTESEEDLGVNGTVRTSASGVDVASEDFFEVGKNGTAVKENVVEVIAYKSALNTAQRRLVANYLAEKHDLEMASHDYYQFGNGHPNDIAGIGRAVSDVGASSGGKHTKATAARFTITENGSNPLADGEFVVVGHDGEAESFTTDERPNGEPHTQKVEREWRAEVTGTAAKTVDVEVDFSSLSLPSGHNDRAVFVDDDGDFTSGATYHDLDNKSGDVYEASGVTVEDGDYVTIASIKRTASFTTAEDFEREDTGNSPNLGAEVVLNYPNDDGDITVDFTDTGDLDGSGNIEDGGATNSAGDNGNGDYEADDGSGNDTGGSQGSFDGDYRLSNSSVTISAGNTANTLGIELDDDNITGPPEQSEKFKVTISAVGTGAAVSNTDDRFVGTIIDDDHPNKVAYSGFGDNDGREKQDASYNETTQSETATTLVYEVAVPDGRTGNSSPATEVTYEVTGGTATPDTDFALVDGRNGTRVDGTTGIVTIPEGDQYGRFEVDILTDNTFEGDETVTLELTEAQGGTLDGNDTTAVTLTISEDDPSPEVEFTSGLFTSPENTDATLNVALSEAAGTDITVEFEDEGTGSATDYTFPSPPTITIPAGGTGGTFTIPVSDDDTRERSKDVDVGIKSATGATLGSRTSAAHTIIDDDGIGRQGPGGVGNDETIAFWGKASGVEASDGTEVTPWPDSSGNGNDATEVVQSDFGTDIDSDPATFATAAVNGQPTLDFTDDGSDQRFYDVESTVMTSLPDDNYTLFGISTYGNSGNPEALLDVQTSGANKTLLSFRYQNSGATIAILSNSADGQKTVKYMPSNTSSLKNDPHLLSAEVDGDELDISYDGKERDQLSGQTWEGTGAAALIGHGLGDQRDLQGQMPEFIAYDTDLNLAQRNLVRNYLSAKYDVGLAGNDLYAGDQSGNGNYDFNVIGIGREGGGDINFLHARAESGGVTLKAETVADGEYAMLGTTAEHPHGPAQRLNYEGTSGVAGLTTRPDSIWFADVTGTPSFDVTFDLEALGFESRPRQNSGYVLLEAGKSSCTPENNDCSWNDAGGTVRVNGDEVTFEGVSLSSGGHYVSIGTTAPTESPLVSEYARPVEGEAGTNGADEGWRYVGVPVTGATVNDLQPPLSTDRDGLVGVGERDVWYWALNNGSQNNDGWTQFKSGEAVPNGRGFIVHLSDDSEHPIDPTLWMDVEPNGLPPGGADVTVGDNTPSADTDLRTDTTWHLLANPYAVDYDLSALNLDTDGDSDTTDDFKKGAQLWDPYLESYKTVMQAGDDTDHLAPWEAFFLERNDFDGGASTQITFGGSGRQSTDNEDFIGSKRSSTPAHRQIELRLIARDETGAEQARDEAVGLYFHEKADPGEDAYDLSKLMPTAQDFAALGFVERGRDGEQSLWAVQSRTLSPSEPVEIPLQLHTDLTGSFSIAAPDWQNVPSDWRATLVDTKGTSDPSDDVTHELGRDGASPYVFADGKSKGAAATEQPSANGPEGAALPPVQTLQPASSADAKSDQGAKATDAPDARFTLRVDPSAEPLPVELASIEATVSDQSVQMAWTTASEQNNAGFYVEHQRLPLGDTTATPQPEAWNEQSFVEGGGTTQERQEYSTQLQRLDYGRHLLRLRQVDTDGQTSYSKVVEAHVRLDKAHDVSAPYPNPARQRATLDVTVRDKQSLQVQLYDMLGRRVQTVYDETVPAQNTTRIDVRTGRLASGVYFLRVEGKDFTETRRMTVVR